MASYTTSDVTSAKFAPLVAASDPALFKFTTVNYVASDVSSFNYKITEKPNVKNDYIFNISSNVKLYRDRDSELDASKNILRNVSERSYNIEHANFMSNCMVNIKTRHIIYTKLDIIAS